MSITSLRAVFNGYVYTLEGVDGEFIGTSLQDILRVHDPNRFGYCVYAGPESFTHLHRAVAHAKAGRMIDAVKAFRQVYSPTLGLKEAKQLTEAIMSQYPEIEQPSTEKE
jgi:hypothetical protein